MDSQDDLQDIMLVTFEYGDCGGFSMWPSACRSSRQSPISGKVCTIFGQPRFAPQKVGYHQKIIPLLILLGVYIYIYLIVIILAEYLRVT